MLGIRDDFSDLNDHEARCLLHSNGITVSNKPIYTNVGYVALVVEDTNDVYGIRWYIFKTSEPITESSTLDKSQADIYDVSLEYLGTLGLPIINALESAVCLGVQYLHSLNVIDYATKDEIDGSLKVVNGTMIKDIRNFIVNLSLISDFRQTAIPSSLEYNYTMYTEDYRSEATNNISTNINYDGTSEVVIPFSSLPTLVGAMVSKKVGKNVRQLIRRLMGNGKDIVYFDNDKMYVKEFIEIDFEDFRALRFYATFLGLNIN